METSGRSSECACLRAKVCKDRERVRVWGALVGLPFGKVTVSSLLNTCHFMNARAWHEYILVFTEVRGRERACEGFFSRCVVCTYVTDSEHTEGDVWRRIDGRVDPRRHASALVGGGRSAERGHSALGCGTHPVSVSRDVGCRASVVKVVSPWFQGREVNGHQRGRSAKAQQAQHLGLH